MDQGAKIQHKFKLYYKILFKINKYETFVINIYGIALLPMYK